MNKVIGGHVDLP